MDEVNDPKPQRYFLAAIAQLAPMHRQDCPYICEQLRTPDWKPNPETQKQVDEKVA
ncbi:hypothetical protein K432DRAFT_411163 [Lepidopterella palustris CBS 459.81]|uniref:Uncharacterized protein n=1 Tax=Lepidopterella palustris CBS 459.81 TaxID=1314670 RepID=A0A8E2DWA6_9PEZI|nr:hypothetical protein K432DRAFT_411163 [Lepidopterella palustris CBS 459.81]